MMKRLTIIRMKFILLTVMLILLSGTNIRADERSFEISFKNLTQTASNVLEFDVYLLDTDPEQNFELDSCQIGFLINSLIYTGGTLSATIDNTNSGLNSAQQFSANPILTTPLVGYPNQTLVRLDGRISPGAGNGTIISSNGNGTLLTHFVLTSTVDFTSNSTPDIVFNSSDATDPIYPTRVSMYIDAINTPLDVTPGSNANVYGNPSLNSSPTAFNLTGGGSYCEGTSGVEIGLDDSENGVTYRLYNNGSNLVAVVSGTGSAISFGDHTAGSYTATGTNVAGTNDMNGTISVTENPNATISLISGDNDQTVCVNSLITNIVYSIGGGGTGAGVTGLPTGLSGSFSGATFTITGSPSVSGVFPYTVTTTGNCTQTSANGTITVRAAQLPNAGPDQTGSGMCGITTTTLAANAPEEGTGFWSIESGTGGSITNVNSPTSTFTGIAGTTYVLRWTISNPPCASSYDDVTITFHQSPTTANAGPDQTGSDMCGLTTTTLAANTPSIGTGNWSIVSGSDGSIEDPSNPSSTFSGLAGTTYTLRWTISNPPCASSTDDVTITFQQDPSAPAVSDIIQPSCTLPTGSVTLSGLPAAGWTIVRTPGGNTYPGTGVSTTISGLVPGTYTFTVTNLNGCTSVPSASVVINAQPLVPTAPSVGTITQPTCTNSTGSVSLGDLPDGSWTITRSPGGVTTMASGNSIIIGDLPAGETYTFTVTNSSGCTSTASAPVVIGAQPQTPTAPVIGNITHPTCEVSTGSVALSGLPASGTWTLTRFPDNMTFTGTGTTSTVSGLAAGTTYFFTVTNSLGCTSPVSDNVPVNTQPLTPSMPVLGDITQPDCSSPGGSVVLNGLPGTGTWALTCTPGGTTIGSGTSYTVTGLAEGSYTFTVTNTDGCTSEPTSEVVINAAPDIPTAPIVGAITQPTCSVATGSVIMTGLPSTGTWTLTRNPGNVTTSGTGASTIVSGIPAGSYTFTVTNSFGCISESSGQVLINSQPPSPPVPTQTVDCSQGFGNAVVTVTSPTGAGYTYSLSGGGFQESVTFTNVANGSHNITVRNSSGCITTGSSFTVNCGCVNPPTVTLSSSEGSTCGTSPITVSGNVFGGSASSVTLTEDGAGSLSPPSFASSPFSFTYTPAASDVGKTVTITITTDNPLGSPCSPASASYTLTVNAVPDAPVIGAITQPTCLVATGSVVLSGLPGIGAWTLIRMPGEVITSGSGTSTTISGLEPNTYTFIVRNATGCSSANSANVTILPQPVTPTAPVVGQITQPSCKESTGSVVLSGLPATGTWTLTRTPGGTITTGSGTSYTVLNIPQNDTYTYTVTNSSGCTSGPSQDVVIQAQPLTPTAPVVGTVTQPTCDVSTGSVVLNGLPATGTWILTRLPDMVQTPGTGVSATVSMIPAGKHVYRVTNADGCTSDVSGQVEINAPLVTPTAPQLGTISQPTCTNATGSVVLNGLPSGGTWTLLRSPDNVTTTGVGSSITISGLNPGTYSFRVTNADGCVSGSSGNVVINAQPPTPTAPVVGTVTQPTCAVPTGSVVLSGLPASGTWTLTRYPGPVTITGTGSSRTVTGLSTGTYTFTVTNSSGCTSLHSGVVVINAQPVTPSAPVIGTVTQPTCDVSTGSIEVTGLPATGSWALTRYPDMMTFNGSGSAITISNLSANTYRFTVTNSDGCTSTTSSDVTIDTQPPTPAAPVIGTITQPTCFTATGSVVLNGLPSAGWTITRYPGGNIQSGTGVSVTISNLSAGTYNFTVTNLFGCTSGSSVPVVINSQPPTPSVPTHNVDCTQGHGRAVVTVTSPTGTGYEYRIDAGSFQTSNVFSNVANGNHAITVRNSDGCTTSGPSFLVSCGCANPPTLSLRSANGSTCGISPVTVSGNTFGGTATRVTLTENGAGTLSHSSLSTSPFSFTYTPAASDAGNTITITVTTDNPQGTPCVAATATYTLRVYALPLPPTIGIITQPTCNEATGGVVLNGLPSTGTWTVIHVQSDRTYTGAGVTTSITGLGTGTHNFMVTNSLGCTSLQSSNVVINAQPPTPAPPVIGSITHPTCRESTGSVVLSGLPATGTWTITRLPAGSTITGSGPTRTITGINSGTHTFTVRNSAGCTSAESAQVVINAQPETPLPPVIDSIAHPTCTVSTGRIYISGLPATGTWTLTRYSEGVVTTGTGTTTVVSGLSAGTYTFTVRNADGCISNVSSVARVNTQPPTPTAPVVGRITHPTFSVPTGRVVLSGLPSSGVWTITRMPGNVRTTGTGVSRTISGLNPGNYTFTVTNSFGCTSGPSANVRINARPGPPTVVINNPPTICSDETTDLTLPAITEGSDENLTYSYWLNSGATDSLKTPEATPPGIYYIRGTTTAGYSITKEVVVSADQKPIADAGPDQELNYVLETTLNAAYLEYGTGTWSVVTGSGSFESETDTLTNVTGLSIGDNIFLWTVTNGVCKPVTDEVLVRVNDLLIPTLITPNGDPYNEYFVINGLEETLGRTELVIFDRRGMQVFRSDNYKNDWNGLDDNGKELPEDTYFWVLRSANGKSLSGFIVIRR